jgi:methyl-accepting chemotaxis protein
MADAPAFQQRTDELFAASQSRRAAVSDRAMIPIFVIEWALTLVLAIEVAPRLWPAVTGPDSWQLGLPPEGLAVLGLVPVGAAILLALVSPGRPLTRYVAVTTQFFLAGTVLGYCRGGFLCELGVYGSVVGLSFYSDYGVFAISTACAAVALALSSTYGFWSLPLAWGYLLGLSALGFRMTYVSRRQIRVNAQRKARLDLQERQRNETLQTLREAGQTLERTVKDLLTTSREQHALVQRQAASLHETSSTIQEIRQTSAVSASRAEIVLKVASKAEDLGQAGQNAVESSLSGLRGIREQVAGIVGQIQNLAERTAAVGEIVDTVQDLADQSNVLALNAAIEASRAGELGKGFGVVAREIRTLADQSIQSTGRIRAMIAEIQNAIHGAVGETEQGNLKLEEGLTQIRASGENLQEMAGVMQESGQAARQIAASVSQQDAGIGQIATAVGSLGGAMDETAEGIRALEASATDLRSTSARIAELVEGLRGGGGGRPSKA